MSSRLQLPSRKLLLEHVARSERIGPHPTIKNLDAWCVDLDGGKTLKFCVAWVQGTVLESGGEKSFTLSDDTGTIRVDTSKSNPPVGEMQPGRYVMVVGEMVAPPGGRVSSIQASKVQDLTSDPTAARMWKQEVADLHAHAL